MLFNKLTLICILILFSQLSWAFSLQEGDVILFSYNCYECRMIESETGAPYSHSGIVVRDSDGELKIAQALTKVHLTSLVNFLKPRTPGTKVLVRRSRELMNRQISLTSIFKNEFEGLAFDSDYLWDNVDQNGRELIYCSELLAKLLNHVLTQKLRPYPLTYQKHYDYWYKHFQGHVPEGVLGNSPASFAQNPAFITIGEL